MTGIERLVDIVSDGPYSGGMIHISVQKLREICEKIEREVDDISGYESDVLAFVEEKGGLDEVKKRLMPEGMSWPLFEDGEPVRIGDELEHEEQGHRFIVDAIEFMSDGWRACYENGSIRDVYRPGDRVKRPSPKVLDADGVEIHEGDTVWNVSTGEKYTVGVFVGGCVNISNAAGGGLQLLPSQLTHRAPVLAADGKPLREGETVWNVDGTGPYEVSSIDGNLVKMDSGACINRCNLTHERPESWERLDDDATMPAATYCERVGIEVEEGHSFVEPMARDLVRRCKAFAERGQR